MASASSPAVQSWHEPTSLWLVPKIEETTLWETLQKHWGGVYWGGPNNQKHQQRRRSDRNTRLAQTLDSCDKAQWILHWRPVNVFCKINSCLKRKRAVCRTFEMTYVRVYCMLNAHLFLQPHFVSNSEEIFNFKTNLFGLIVCVTDDTVPLESYLKHGNLNVTPLVAMVTRLWLTQLHQARYIGK